MRYLAVAVICLVVGFGAGWLAFDWPFDGGSDPTAAAERFAAAQADGEVARADCTPLASPARTWHCSILRPGAVSSEQVIGQGLLVSRAPEGGFKVTRECARAQRC